MLAFWILATLMTAVALAFALVPLLRARPAAAPTPVEANLEVLRGQRREIEADIANGTLPAEERDEALADLVERARDDLAGERPAVAAMAGRPWALAAVVAIAIPALAFGVYLAVGAPGAADPRAVPPASARLDDDRVIALVEDLAVKVRERPADVQGWTLLARSMAALGRFEESAQAYAHLAMLVPGEAQVLADYADVLGMAQGRMLAGRPYELARQALAVDPAHRKALALAGTAAMDAGDFTAAAAYWRRLAAELPADSPDAAQVASILEEIGARAAAAGKPLPPAAKQAAQPAAAAKSVSGSVSVSPEIAAKVGAADTLFVFARAEGGARMPLAVVRAAARELPMKFALDDSQAMAPGVTISSAPAVRIEARISRSGDATPQPGDLVGTSAVVKPGARDVKVVVDRVLP